MRRALFALALPLILGCKQETPGSAPTSPTTATSAPTATVARVAEAPGELRYLERTTGGASPGDRLPLLVAIHGMGDRPEAFVRLFDSFRGKARLIVPYAPDPQGNGYSWFPTTTPRLNLDAIASGTERASHRLASLITSLAAQRPTAGRPIVTGFSQGGMLSFTLAVLHPEAIGEAYPVAGLLAPLHWPSSWAAGKIEPKVVSFHGDADHVVPLAVDRQSVEKLQAIGFDVALHVYPGVDHTISAEMRRDLYQALDEAVKRAATP